MYLPCVIEQYMAIPSNLRGILCLCLCLRLRLSLRLSLVYSLSLPLSLSFLFCLNLTAQTYKFIEPKYELQPYNLNMAEEQVGMNSAVQSMDGFLWIGSTKGLIISDGHASVMYTNDNPMYPLGLSDPNAFVGNLHGDSMGNVFATVSTGGGIIRFDKDSRTIAEEWNLDEQVHSSSFFFDVTPHGEVFALITDIAANRFSIWKMNSTGSNHLIFQDNIARYGTILSYQWFQSMHWVQTRAGILRISNDGENVIFHTYSQSLPTNTYRASKGEHYYFYDYSLRTLMYWDSKMTSPSRYAKLPEKVQVNSGHFMVRNELLYLANGYYFFIVDTLHHTIQDLSKETYDMKKEFYPDAISEDILGFHSIDQQVFLLGSKFLYQLKTKPPRKEKFQSLVPYMRSDISMRGLAEDEHQNVYTSFYNGVAIKSKDEEHFNAWSPLIGLDGDLYSSYSLTYSSPYLFWHCLKINTQNGDIAQTVPNVINGHIVHVLTGDTLWLYTWYGNKLYTYDIPDGKLDSVSIESPSGSKSVFPYIVNEMVSNSDHTAIWMATGRDGIVLVSRRGRILASYTVEELGTRQADGINDILLDGQYLWYGCSEGIGRLNIQTREYTLYKDPSITSAMQQRPRTIFTILPDERKGFYLGSIKGWFISIPRICCLLTFIPGIHWRSQSLTALRHSGIRRADIILEVHTDCIPFYLKSSNFSLQWKYFIL